VKLFIMPRIPWRSLRMVLQLLDQARKFGVFQPFPINNGEPIWYNEGKGKYGPLFFILPGKSVDNPIFFSLLINDLIIIAR
jgi:hypothetical protein